MFMKQLGTLVKSLCLRDQGFDSCGAASTQNFSKNTLVMFVIQQGEWGDDDPINKLIKPSTNINTKKF